MTCVLSNTNHNYDNLNITTIIDILRIQFNFSLNTSVCVTEKAKRFHLCHKHLVLSRMKKVRMPVKLAEIKTRKFVLLMLMSQ